MQWISFVRPSIWDIMLKRPLHKDKAETRWQFSISRGLQTKSNNNNNTFDWSWTVHFTVKPIMIYDTISKANDNSWLKFTQKCSDRRTDWETTCAFFGLLFRAKKGKAFWLVTECQNHTQKYNIEEQKKEKRNSKPMMDNDEYPKLYKLFLSLIQCMFWLVKKPSHFES